MILTGNTLKVSISKYCDWAFENSWNISHDSNEAVCYFFAALESVHFFFFSAVNSQTFFQVSNLLSNFYFTLLYFRSVVIHLHPSAFYEVMRWEQPDSNLSFKAALGGEGSHRLQTRSKFWSHFDKSEKMFLTSFKFQDFYIRLICSLALLLLGPLVGFEFFTIR